MGVGGPDPKVRRASTSNAGGPRFQAGLTGLPELTAEVDVRKDGFVFTLVDEFLRQVPVGAERHEDRRRISVAGPEQSALGLLDIAVLERNAAQHDIAEVYGAAAVRVRVLLRNAEAVFRPLGRKFEIASVEVAWARSGRT